MNETKKVIADEIQEALEEKRMIESQLSNLCLNPKNVGRWRKIQSRLALVTLQNRAEIRQKLHGMNLFSKKDDDEARFRKISQVKIEESKKRERRRCTLYHDMRFHQLWSYFLMMLLCYTIVMVPLSLALVDYKENPGLYYFDFVVNGFFLADILFSMRTALDEERDSLFEIFIAYAKSWLVFDIIAVIPFDLIIGDSVAGITLITKIPRFMRIFRIFKLMKLGGSMKKNKIFKRISEFLNINAAVTKLLQFFVTMVIIIHVTGCLWIFLAKNDDYGPGTWVYE